MSNIDFKQYADLATYEAATKPTEASRISEITATGKMMVDAVNVPTTEPEDGDVLFYDASKKLHVLKGGEALNASTIPEGWTHMGYLFDRRGDTMKVLHYGGDDLKYAAYAEYSITAIADTAITIYLRLSNSYGSNTAIEVTLEDTTLSAANAALINDAIVAKCTEVGATNVPWAYYDEDNDKIVIVVAWNDYRQYICSGTNCTIALTIWDDMPATTDAGFRCNGIVGNERVLNATKAAGYSSTNGVTPETAVTVNSATGIVTSDAFTNSEYCAALRAAYSAYVEYVEKEYQVMHPQSKGLFRYSAKELTSEYGNRTVRLADSTTAYAFPALHYGLTVGFAGVEGFEAGDWWMNGAEDGAYFMRDDVYDKIRASQTKMSDTLLSNTVNRWFAQRYYVSYAWIFYRLNGRLNFISVPNTFRVGTVALLNISKL